MPSNIQNSSKAVSPTGRAPNEAPPNIHELSEVNTEKVAETLREGFPAIDYAGVEEAVRAVRMPTPVHMALAHAAACPEDVLRQYADADAAATKELADNPPKLTDGITCPHCSSHNWTQLRKDLLDPAKDKFECSVCHRTFKRYEGTQYDDPHDSE